MDLMDNHHARSLMDLLLQIHNDIDAMDLMEDHHLTRPCMARTRGEITRPSRATINDFR